MKILLLSIVVVSTIIVAGCTTPLATPTPAPATATPVEEPSATAVAAESTSHVEQMDHVVDPNLINKTWVWEKRDPNGNQIPAIVVSEPEKYTLTFDEDRKFTVKMDCNSATGRYATPSPGNIFMDLGATTLAECGPDSLAGDMANMFGPVQSYRYEEDGTVLIFVWVAGGPLDALRAMPQ